MSDPPSLPARRRILLKLFLAFCALSAIAFALLAWYVTTDAFQQKMRHRVVAELERATGGRVELGELHTIPFRLRVDIRSLTIHGREASGQRPFFQVERVEAELKIISLLGTSIGLHSLVLEHPVVHVIDNPDGTTNLPVPLLSSSYGRTFEQGPVERLISLSVSRIEVQKGELLWEDEKIPFNFDARDLAILLNYSLLRQRYEAHMAAADIDTHWQQYPEFVWSADASLVLARGHADISSLILKSGKSEFQFAGQLQDFHDPTLSGEYRGAVDLGELASILRMPEIRKGTAQFKGKGTWSDRDFSTDGTLQAKDVDWSSTKVAMRNGRAEAAFQLTPVRLRLSSLKANLMGGGLTGEVDVSNWQNSLESVPSPARSHVIGRIAAASLQRGSVRLQLAGFPLTPVLDVLSSKSLPLNRLNFAGNASGTIDMLWVGSIRDAETRMKMGLSPPSRVEPSQVAVHGEFQGVYRGSRDEIEIGTLHLSASGSEITASGNLAASSSMHFAVTSHNVKDWTPILEAAYGASPLPFTVHGWANLTGTATGRVSAPTITGNLEAYDFETSAPATQSAPRQSIHWDAFSAIVQFSRNSFAARRGSLIHGHTVAHFDASGALAEGSLSVNAPFTLRLDVLDADVAEVAQWAGVRRPLSGDLGFSVNLSGTRSNPHGDGRFEIRDGAAYGVGIPSFRGNLKLAGDDLELNNLDARAYNAALTGRATINTATHEIQVNAEGRDINLARFPRLPSSRIAVDGVADFTARLSGTLQEPALEAHVRVKDIALDKERAGDFHLDATTRGRVLDLEGHSDFDQSNLKIQGSVDLHGDFRCDLTFDFQHLNVVSLVGIYFPGKITDHAPVDGTIHVRGSLRTPRDLVASAELRTFSAEVDRVQVAAVEPIRFEVAEQTVLLERFHLAGSGTDFTAHGRAHLSGAQEIDLQLNGSVNMALMQSLNPKLQARGALDVNVAASGSLAYPVLQGRIDVKNTFLSHNDFPSGLSDLNGVMLFDRNRIQIEKLAGTTGGGTIALSGSASYQGEGAFLLDLGATAQGVRLRYPPGVSSTANADLRLTGSSNSALLSGDVVVTKLAVTPGFDFGAYIERSRQSVVFAQTDSLESRLRLDVHVTTTPELQMQTAVARLSGDADLRIRGTADRPVILGRAEVLEGDISFNGTKYRLERGDVTFTNPAKTQPIVDLQAATRVRDYDITIRLRGDASVPNGLKVTWQSEPSLPEGDVIALVALGRTQEESAAAAQANGTFGFGGEASDLLINEALNSTVNGRLQKLFGASRIKIDPQGLTSETNIVRGPQLTIEQQVASNVTLTYSTNVSVSSQQIIQGEYNITRSISIIALRDQNGVVSFDLRIRSHLK
ncbi:MAG: translocation/assembly module TamB domain-containing protein [Terriglobales bacterium]